MSGSILSFILKLLQEAGDVANNTPTKWFQFQKCIEKFSKYLDLTENNVDGHLQSCMQYCGESGDVVDTCSCNFYLKVYPVELVKEINEIFYSN